MFDLKKRYLRNQFKKFDATVAYKNEALAQVNPQLLEWLETINAEASKNSIRNDSEKIKMSDEKIFSARQEESYSTKSILTQLNAETVSQLDADGKKLLQSYQRMAKWADYYRDQIDQLRAEKNAWKGKSIHAGSVLNSALASKNAEINELQRKLENTEKIMAGQVRNPQIARLVNTARDQAVKELREEKNAKIDQIRQEKNAQIDKVRTQYQTSIANAREGRAVTELHGKIRRVAEDIKGRITAPSDTFLLWMRKKNKKYFVCETTAIITSDTHS